MKNKLFFIVLGWCSSFNTFVIACEQSPQIERLPSPKTTLGEVPHWDPQTRSLYYVDIHDAEDYSSSLLRYDYDENRVYSATIDGARILLFLLPIECTKDQFLVGIDTVVIIVKWDGRSLKATVIRPLFELDCGVSNVLINDVKADERGRFYGGTRNLDTTPECVTNSGPIGAFYRYESGKCLRKIFGNVTISNGLTWVRKTNKFYYVDSCTYDIKEFDYNPNTGDLSHRHQIISSLMQNGKRPDYVFDGMTNDRDGNLYVAAFGGNKIVKIDPKSGKFLMEIKLPAEQITSLAFGGPDLDILYVTTANKDGKQSEGSGYLYKVTGLLAKGYAGVKFRLFDNCVSWTLFKSKKCYPFCKSKQ